MQFQYLVEACSSTRGDGSTRRGVFSGRLLRRGSVADAVVHVLDGEGV